MHFKVTHIARSHELANVLLINVRISKEKIYGMQNAIVMNLNDWKVYSKAI